MKYLRMARDRPVNSLRYEADLVLLLMAFPSPLVNSYVHQQCLQVLFAQKDNSPQRQKRETPSPSRFYSP